MKGDPPLALTPLHRGSPREILECEMARSTRQSISQDSVKRVLVLLRFKIEVLLGRNRNEDGATCLSAVKSMVLSSSSPCFTLQ
jgi:hypothetical protein